MKLMKIFGMVFALHVALACVLVLIQGCRTTAPSRAPEPVSAAVAPVEPESGNWTSQPSSSSAGTPMSPGGSYASRPVTGAPLSGLSPAERERMEPTRPDNQSAYISTGTPAALAEPPPGPVDYVVRAGDSLWKIARNHKSTTGELQKLNPTIRADVLRPGMIIKVPGTAAASLSVPATPGGFSLSPSAPDTATYIVKAGDSLSKIAARNGTTVAALRDLNSLRGDVIQIGQELKVPGGSAASSPPTFSLGGPPSPAPGAADDTEKVTVIVQRGDTLGEIAQKFGVTVRDLMAENNITNAARVQIGQKLVIPGFHAVGTGTVPQRPASAPPPAQTQPAPRAAPPPAVEPAPELEPPDDENEAPPVVPIEGEPMPAP